MKMNKLFLSMLLALGTNTALHAAPLLKDGDSIAILGDSITEHGTKEPMGYVNLIKEGFKEAGLNIKVYPAGISGQTCRQMLPRVDRDVIAKKPTWLCLSCGVNDAPNAIDNPGVPLEEYKEKITRIIDKCTAAGIKCMIFTATMVIETPDCIQNKNLAPYNAYLRELAKQRDLPLIEMFDREDAVARKNPFPEERFLTIDGTHMNTRGNIVMATGILLDMGFEKALVERLAAEWTERAGGMKITIPLSVAEYDLLRQKLPGKSMQDQEKEIRRILLDAAKK